MKRSESGSWAGSLFLPFNETIARVFPWQIYPKTGDHGRYYHRGIKEEDEFKEIQNWIAARADLVFIRSLFDTAVATCEHFQDKESRSPIGTLEYKAKYESSASARDQLATVVQSAFERIHAGLGVNAILSVPSSTEGALSLPNLLAGRLSDRIGLPDLTGGLTWNGAKGKIKELSVEEKWGALESVGLSVDGAIAGKNLLLIDDMYQSGATAHFVASRLRAAGANDLHMLAVSKGRRDTDNT